MKGKLQKYYWEGKCVDCYGFTFKYVSLVLNLVYRFLWWHFTSFALFSSLN